MLSRTVLVGCLVAASCAVPSGASAQSIAQSGRIAVSGTIGMFRPTDSSMSAVYGSRLAPLGADLDVRVAPDVSVFAGVKWMRSNGQTIVTGTPVIDERYPTSLHTTTLRFGGLVSKFIVPRWEIGAGAGVSTSSYEEAWPDAALTASGRSTGFLALAEARYTLRLRWQVLGRVEYSTAHANDALGVGRVDLGGVDLSAGVRFVF